jgi:hypothetical protein
MMEGVMHWRQLVSTTLRNVVLGGIVGSVLGLLLAGPGALSNGLTLGVILGVIAGLSASGIGVWLTYLRETSRAVPDEERRNE